MAVTSTNFAPFTGNHDLIAAEFGASRAPAGGIECLSAAASGLTLAESGGEFAAEGRFVSAPISLKFPANEMILTWNCFAPDGARIEIEFRVRDGNGGWSGWYQPGPWRPEQRKGLKRKSILYGTLDVDHLKTSRMFDRVQYRVKFESLNGAQTPLLRRVSICVSDTQTGRNKRVEPSGYAGPALDLGVPWLSQYDPVAVRDAEMIRCGVCAATSVTMVLNYYGIPVEVADIGRRAYDPNAKIFGNWAYLIAAASEFGPSAWVQRFNSLDELTPLLERGIPPIISVSYGRGDLSAKHDRESRGHLIVVRGVTKAGDLICNDPDAREPDESGRPIVYGREEIARAFFRRGGIALIID
jgi:hypothetical protein